MLSPKWQSKLDGVAVDPAVHEKWPGYRVLVIVVDGIDQGAISAGDDADSPLSKVEAAIREQGVSDWTTHPHVAEWFEAFREFGAKPKRTSPSVLALLKRVENGLPRIDPVTDLYNSISVGHVLPIGGEDFATYSGDARLILAQGDEPFDTIDQGEPANDPPIAGEVVWRDGLGVTCRRWNWRQCVRTRITAQTTTVLFLLEALGAMPDSELLAAGDELIAGLRSLAPNVEIGQRLIGG